MRLLKRFWSTKYQLCANSAENKNWADCRTQTRCWLEHEIYGCLFPPVAAHAQKSGIRPLQARPPILWPSQVQAAHLAIAQKDGKRNSCRPQSQSPGRNSWALGQLENAQQLSRGWCSPDPQGNDGSPYGTFCGGSCCWSSQEVREDGSPPENVPQQLPQSTNDLEACMPPTSRSWADHYSASLSARDNTQSARVHRMPSSRNQRVQSSIRWTCVQLEQHRQSETSTKRTGRSLTKTTYQMRIELGVIPKIPSSSRGIEECTSSATRNS